jgi:hypothetical protein
MGKNKDNQGRQQRAVHREPGHHGEKTISRMEEIEHSGAGAAREADGPRYDPQEIREHKADGGHRLFEDRQQHDEADKNSEKTRLARDRQRHRHDSSDELTQRNRSASAKRKS